jgi:hypothetical protein
MSACACQNVNLRFVSPWRQSDRKNDSHVGDPATDLIFIHSLVERGPRALPYFSIS